MFHVKHDEPGPSSVSRETQERLEIYAALLLHWNQRINLLSHRDEELLWPRHIHDSLALVPYMPMPPGAAIDLGSGAGFPGLILAIATGRHFHLVEADQRKAAFLREAGRETSAPITVHPVRIEACGLTGAGLVTARALAPLSSLLAWTTPLLAPDGACLFPKGRNHTAELTDAASRWQMRVESIPSPTAPDAVILRIRDLKRVRSPT